MLIDSHCHLASLQRRGTLEEALRNAADAGVGRLITIGTSITDWSDNQELSIGSEGKIGYSVGLHPTDIEDDWEEQLLQLSPFFTQENLPVALGEIGLDHFHLPKYPDEAAEVKARQIEVFEHQLALALQFGCPVIIHSRNAFHECIRVIDGSGLDWSRVVFHCFAEGPEEIRLLNDRGGRGSFTGIITYKNAQRIREAALLQGVDSVMVETDAPYLSPEPKRGKPNEPAFVRYTADFCAEIFGMDFEEFAESASRNTLDFFGL